MHPFPLPQQPLLRRRSLLGSLLGLGSLTALSGSAWAQPLPAPLASKPPLDGGRMIVVFLRGAYDGLSAFVPYADRDYYAIRPSIAIAPPDGSAQTSIRLDDTFALHPALSPLLGFWQQGVLGFVPSAGLPMPNRSHFDAQYQMETAQSAKISGGRGWLNGVAGMPGSQTGNAMVLGVGEANPAILGGPAQVKLIPRGQAAERSGVLANEKTRQALIDLYAGNDSMGKAFRQGADSRMQSAQELNTEKAASEKQVMQRRREMAAQMERKTGVDGAPAGAQMQMAEMLAASNGAPDPVGLQLDARNLGTLMRNDRNLRLGFLSAGGWDTHANQGAASGQLANNLGNLARGIVQLRQYFSEPGDVIVVMSEFGRTSAENGTRGTDHGFGNAMWLMGNRVAGGRWHGQWTGLARGNLNEGRDLPAHHDYRAVLAQVLHNVFGFADSQLATVLPGASWDRRLDGLLAKA